jgi:DNA-binding YbaB/EbfC family protein
MDDQLELLTEIFKESEVKLEEMRIESCSGGNFVKVIINGLGNIIDIKVEDSPFIKDDIPMLLDLIKIAFNQAKEKVIEKTREKLLLKYQELK